MPRIRFLRPRTTNLLQTLLLSCGIAGLPLLVGWLFAGKYGLIWAGLLGVLPLIVAMRLYPALILKMYRAKPIPPETAESLAGMVAELARRAGLATPPRLYYIASNLPLIFTTGHGRNSALAVADGVLRLLSLRELYGVLAHEISHLSNYDTIAINFADVLGRVTRTLSFFGLVILLISLPFYIIGDYILPWAPIVVMLSAPTISALLQLGLSRAREYGADMNAAAITGDPEGLACAIAKLEEHERRLAGGRYSINHPSLRPTLLRTHPESDKRIIRLLEMDLEMHPGKDPRQFRCFDLYGAPLDTPEVTGKPRRRLSGMWY